MLVPERRRRAIRAKVRGGARRPRRQSKTFSRLRLRTAGTFVGSRRTGRSPQLPLGRRLLTSMAIHLRICQTPYHLHLLLPGPTWASCRTRIAEGVTRTRRASIPHLPQRSQALRCRTRPSSLFRRRCLLDTRRSPSCLPSPPTSTAWYPQCRLTRIPRLSRPFLRPHTSATGSAIGIIAASCPLR